MAYDYVGSIAQKYIQFVTTVITTAVPGQNFGKLMIFCSETDAATMFVTDPTVDTITELTPSNYKTLLLAAGLLYKWLADFYANGSVTSVFVVTYTSGVGPAIADLNAQYALYVERAYWKLCMDVAHKMAAQLVLAALCATDPLSQFIYGSQDATILTNTGGNEALQFNTLPAPGLDVPIIYHPSAVHNPAMVQLGITLAALNTSGTYVGNKLDFLAVAFTASGTAGANVSAAGLANCAILGVAVFTTLGNGTGQVLLEGATAGRGLVTGLTFADIGVRWLVNYVDTVSSILCTQYMAQPGRFKNNDTYQGCLTILTGQLALFSGMGRLSSVKITAPPFDQLPAAAGGVITVPNAWQATYNNNLRQVTVYGTLYVTA
jgi:hypothetical protein